MLRINTLFLIMLLAVGTRASDVLTEFQLINANTDAVIQVLSDGDTIDLNVTGVDLAIRAVTTPDTVGSVEITLTGAEFLNRIDNTFPYSLHGDASGDYFSWSPGLGDYTLTGNAWQYGGGTGTAGPTLSLGFTVILDLGSTPDPPVGTGAYIESGGLVIMEAETEAASGDWNYRQDVFGYTNEGYYEWKFGDGSLGIDGAGSDPITYEIEFTTTGRYLLELRSAAPDNNDHNDCWVRFQDSDLLEVQGSDENNRGNSWIKLYQNVSGNTWTWQSKTVDFDPHKIYTDINTPGTYRFQISGRSTLFKIDRIALYTNAVSSATAQDISTPESPRVGSCSVPLNPMTSIISPIKVGFQWDAVSNADAYEVEGRVLGAVNWKRKGVSNNIFALNVFTPSTDYEWKVRAVCNGFADTSEFTAINTFSTPAPRVAELLDVTAELMPNPAQDWIRINTSFEPAQIDVFDLSGRMVLSQNAAGQLNEVQVADLEPGMYMILISSSTGEQISQRFVKE